MGCVPSTPGDPMRIQSRGLAVRRSLFLRAKTALCSWLLQVATQHPFASIANTKDSEGRYQANCAVEARRVTGLASLTRLGLPKPPARPRATNSLRWIAARQGTKLNDSKGSVAPARHREKQTLVLQSAAVDTAIRRTSPSEILVLRAQLQALSAPP